MPGEHFYGERRLGSRLRDTILILLPGPKMMPVKLLRSDLDGTIVETVLKHGCGALNIDGCRVEACRKQAMAGRGVSASCYGNYPHGYVAGLGRQYSSEGRWPPNLLLVHGPQCRQVGTTDVAAPIINRFTDGMKPFGEGAGHSYEQTGGGIETVPVWDCQPDCPIKMIDEMSGYSTTKPHAGGGKPLDTQDAGWGFRRMASDLADEGMASRFFPQFANLDDALAWLQRLIGVDVSHAKNHDWSVP